MLQIYDWLWWKLGPLPTLQNQMEITLFGIYGLFSLPLNLPSQAIFPPVLLDVIIKHYPWGKDMLIKPLELLPRLWFTLERLEKNASKEGHWAPFIKLLQAVLWCSLTFHCRCIPLPRHQPGNVELCVYINTWTDKFQILRRNVCVSIFSPLHSLI